MFRIKKKKILPRWNSFCGFSTIVWEKLNAGETVEVVEIPKAAIPYIEQIKKEK